MTRNLPSVPELVLAAKHNDPEPGDFSQTVPEMCMICTGLTRAEIKHPDNPATPQIQMHVALASHLGIGKMDEIEAIVSSYEAKGFRIVIVEDSLHGIISGELDPFETGIAMLELGKPSRPRRGVTMVMPDAFVEGNVYVMCWIFAK